MPRTNKPPQFTQQLTVCLDPASAGALAIAAEIDRSSPSALSRRIITDALTARGLLQHPALSKYPELNPEQVMTLDQLSRQILEVRIRSAAKRVERAEAAYLRGEADWHELFDAQRQLTQLQSYRET